LNDLAIKRKALHLQIDQLRAARDSLATFVTTLRQQVDDILSGINGSDEAARAAALDALRSHAGAPEPTEEELLAGTPLREVPVVALEPADPGAEGTPGDAKPATKRRSDPAPAPLGESLLEDDPSGTDVVNEIFARLRKATLEERGATALAPKKVAASKPETPVGVLFRHRDEALDESLGILTRRVKRALQDDQNIMLERIRNVKAMITDELEDELVQRSRYAEAAGEALAQARKPAFSSRATKGASQRSALNPHWSMTARPTSLSPSCWRCVSASCPSRPATVPSA